MVPEPFRIDIPQQRLDEMNRRLATIQWPGDFGNADWHYGVEQEWLREIGSYWATEFDWRAQEAAMNAFPHYRVQIDGVPIHFIHLRSGRADAVPIILTHGWPWTFWDWAKLIDPLSQGTSACPPFDVIVPSLPGFAFSSPLRTTGLDIRAIAKLWVRLMSDVLGYQRFCAAGGDWGALITAELGHAHPERILGIHLTLVGFPGMDMLAIGKDDYAADEQWMLDRNRESLPTITSHVAVQASDPQTLAYGLADSPIGTAAWLWERRRAWSDCDGDIVAAQGRDFLCTTASLYWLTNTIGTSFRIYKETLKNEHGMPMMDWPLLHDRLPSIPVPTGVAVAPKEVALKPRSVAEARSDLRRWQVMERGGHFLPAEDPQGLVREYQIFFGDVLAHT